MRIALSVVFAALIALLGLCAFVAFKKRKKKPIGLSLALVLLALMWPVAGNLLIIASPKEPMSLAGCYIYYIGMDILMIALIRFAFDYCHITWHSKTIKAILYSILTADIIQLLVNTITHHAFTIELIQAYGADFYDMIPLLGQTIHRVIDYAVLAGILVVFVVKAIITPRVYSEKYFVIIIAMAVFGAMQTYFIFSNNPIDFSMIGFAIFGLLLFALSLYYRPLRLMDRMLAAIASKMSESLFFFDASLRCVWANTKGYELLGIEENELSKVSDALRAKIGEFDKDDKEWARNFTKGEGEEFTSYAVEKHKVTDHRNKLVGFYISVRDNSAEKKELLEESYNAKHDALTKIYNRAGYDMLMEQVDLSRVFLVLIDGDSFKNINDQYGHTIGDKALIRITDSLCSHFRDEDYVCRIGGDEFAVIMPEVDDRLVGTVGERIKNINRELTKFARDLPPTTISAGGAYGRDAEDAYELFNNADHALYETKFNGKAGFTIFKTR